jgi:hypothetical protein
MLRVDIHRPGGVLLMGFNRNLMQRQIDLLKSRATVWARRGRDVSSFDSYIANAEAHLAQSRRLIGSNQRQLNKAHGQGLAAMESLNRARCQMSTLTPARNYTRNTTRCDFCGRADADVRFCDDFL